MALNAQKTPVRFLSLYSTVHPDPSLDCRVIMGELMGGPYGYQTLASDELRGVDPIQDRLAYLEKANLTLLHTALNAQVALRDAMSRFNTWYEEMHETRGEIRSIHGQLHDFIADARSSRHSPGGTSSQPPSAAANSPSSGTALGPPSALLSSSAQSVLDGLPSSSDAL